MMNNGEACDERELVARLRDGDYQAFDLLYERYALQVAYKIRRLIKLPEVTEELHQEVFLRVWEQREQLYPENPFLPLLLHMARNISIDYFRKASRSKQFQQQAIQVVMEQHCDVEQRMAFQETQTALNRAISKLPPQRLKIFTMCKLEGKSYEEAAAFFGVSLSTVKDHMHRAMRFLRKELSQYQDPNMLAILLILGFFK